MKRRNFLKFSAISSTLLIARPKAFAQVLPRSVNDQNPNEQNLNLKILEGNIPSELKGHLFVISAIKQENDTANINGDGLVYRLDFDGSNSVKFTSRVMKTPSYFVDHATKNKLLYRFFNRGIMRISPLLGARNQVNTAFCQIDHRLMVTFDAGRPFEIDPTTLRLVTPVGKQSDWKEGLPVVLNQVTDPLFPGVFSTAHPVFDNKERKFYTVNFTKRSFNNFLDLLQWDGSGEIQRFRVKIPSFLGTKNLVIDQSMHQLAVTKDFIILADTCFSVEPLQIINTGVTKAHTPFTKLFIIKKSDLKNQNEVVAISAVLPRAAAHIIVDYQNENDIINLYTPHNSGWDASEFLLKNDRNAFSGNKTPQELLGMMVGPTDLTPIGSYKIDANEGKIIDQYEYIDIKNSWGLQLYSYEAPNFDCPIDKIKNLFVTSFGFQPELIPERIKSSFLNYPNRIVPWHELPSKSTPSTLVNFNIDQKNVTDYYSAPKGEFLNSPQYIPSTNHPGWLVCTVASDNKSATSSGDEFWIFDAQNLANGPVCKLAHPDLNIGFTIHTHFMREISPRKNSDYKINLRTDFAQMLSGRPKWLKRLFETEIFPYYD